VRTLVLMALLEGLCMCALFAPDATAQQMQMQIIELYTRSADEMIPLLRPMLAPGGTISGARDKLVIRTTPENFADLRKILDSVDSPPRRLLISVKQARSGHTVDRDVEISGSAGSDDVRVTVPRKAPSDRSTGTVIREDDGSHVRIGASSTNSGDSGRTVQTVRVNEGSAAFIRMGESIPVRSDSRKDAVEYHDVVTGFYVIARLRGDQVIMQLATRADTVIDRRTGAARIDRISSVVKGRVGEWLEVGNVSIDATTDETGTIYYESSASRDQRRTFIRVEEVR